MRFAAGLGAVAVALGLVGAQFGLAHHYAGEAERAALAADVQGRLAATQDPERRRVR
jgi:hypothetical protein